MTVTDNFGSDNIRDAVADVMKELDLSIAKHPHYPADPLRRTAIMAEEAGEAIKAAVDLTRPPIEQSTHGAPLTNFELSVMREALYKELTQTAAMCIKQMSAMLKEGAVA